MRILLHRGDGVIAPWEHEFATAMPGAELVRWSEGQPLPPTDYAVLWNPAPSLLAQLSGVKAIFLMGAGVDALLRSGVTLPDVPLVRLGDAGMGVQMAEYVTHAVLRYFRRFDDYEQQARQGMWDPLEPYAREDFTIGVMGLGKLGMPVLAALQHFGFPVRGWSRTAKQIDAVQTYAGIDELDAFLEGTRVLVCLLPLTPETNNLLGRSRLSKLKQGAYLINVARGAIISEPDLMNLIRDGHIAGAALDVFRHEPLPAPHPFWNEPRITLTPHISALTVRHQAVRQIVDKIGAIERDQPIADIVNRQLGY